MQSHTIPRNAPNTLVTQAQHDIDVTSDYDLVIQVRGDVVHTYAKNTKGAVRPCIECKRHAAHKQANP